MSEKVVVVLYFRLRFGVKFSVACGFGKTFCSTVDHRNVYNSGKTDVLLIKLILVPRTGSGSQLLGADI